MAATDAADGEERRRDEYGPECDHSGLAGGCAGAATGAPAGGGPDRGLPCRCPVTARLAVGAGLVRRLALGGISATGGDPDFIAITGGPAGAHLASLAALTANDKQLQPGFEDADTTVRAAAPYYGVYDFTNVGKMREMMPQFLEQS